MTAGLRRYEFSERLGDILGESRRDLRVRVTLLVAAGLVPPGRRGPGAPPATPEYAAELLIGVMAAPQQAQTVEAVRCYRDLVPGRLVAGGQATGIHLGPPRPPPGTRALVPCLRDHPRFGAALARLIDRARRPETRDQVANEVIGIWVGRAFPAAAIQLAAWSEGRRSMVTQRYEAAEGSRLPAWLDPGRSGNADPGLLHTVFLPTRKLIDIATLTTSPSDEERTPVMHGLGPAIANLAALARQRRHRRPWQKFLEAAAEAETSAERVDAEPSHLVRVDEFGSNPGSLSMFAYVPDDLPPAAPLVVVLHGCTQTAHSYDHGTGWSTLADRHAFALLLPQQRRRNNPLRCFNWFKHDDTGRDLGEALSIRQMVDRMLTQHGLDHRRVFVTGVSAGGAMTSALLAAYPEVFAGGAVIAGVPYRAASGLQEGFEVIFQGRSRPAGEWGDLVRAASPHAGPWPRVSVWHGDTDKTVTPLNAEEIVKQWADVHGLRPEPTSEHLVEGHRRRVWHDAGGREVVEHFTVAGMAHGVPIDPDGTDGCGVPAPFIVDAGISSGFHIARFWGLTEMRRETKTPRRQPPRPETTPEPAAPMAARVPGAGPHEIAVGRPGDTAAAGERPPRTADAPVAGLDIPAILARSFELAGLFGNPSAKDGGGGTIAGVDIPAILTTSFEAAGLIKPSPGRSRQGSGATIAGIDIASILARSFEAAGLLKPEAATDEPAGATTVAEGWQLLAGDNGPGGATLHGSVSAGRDGEVGSKVRAVSFQVALGAKPKLSYLRRLELSAAVNMLTTAAFTVLVDGVPVDEASAAGMDYAETAWTPRTAIDLAPFADRTVTMTFEVTASANVSVEVFAKAWVRDVVIEDAKLADSVLRPVDAPEV